MKDSRCCPRGYACWTATDISDRRDRMKKRRNTREEGTAGGSKTKRICHRRGLADGTKGKEEKVYTYEQVGHSLNKDSQANAQTPGEEPIGPNKLRISRDSESFRVGEHQ